MECNWLARAERGVVPAFSLVIVDHHHVIGEDLAETGIGNRLRAGGTGDGGGMRDMLEFHGDAD